VIAAGAWAALAAASLLLGAFVAQRFTVAPRVVGRVMGFGAGALVAALAYDLIPDTSVSDAWIWANFGIGALVFYGLDGVLERRASGAKGSGSGSGSGSGFAIALGVLLDGIPESLVLGIGIAVGGSVNVGFLVAVFVSNVPESLAATAVLRGQRPARWIRRLWLSITLVSGVAAAIGYALAEHFTSIDGRYIQAAAAGAVLTMVSDTMMPEAYRVGGRPIALLTALGFGVAAVLTSLG
jgi:ZIP family zinc transporter